MIQQQDVMKQFYEYNADEVHDAGKYDEFAKVLLKMGYPEASDIVKDIAKDERKHNKWLVSMRQSIASKEAIKVREG